MKKDNPKRNPALSKSIREMEWEDFSYFVGLHVGNYTVPQYGDAPDDQLEAYSVSDCVLQIKKYVNRYGKNQREGEALRDFLKIAHYAGVAYFKFLRGEHENGKMETR